LEVDTSGVKVKADAGIMSKLVLHESDRHKIKLRKYPFHSAVAVNPNTHEPMIATINLGYQKKIEHNPKPSGSDFLYKSESNYPLEPDKYEANIPAGLNTTKFGSGFNRRQESNIFNELKGLIYLSLLQ